MRFKDIIIWIILFVIGSLIVSFIVYPETFNEVKQNIENLEIWNKWNNKKTKNLNIIEFTPPYLDSCILVGKTGFSKKEFCILQCGENNWDYEGYNCNRDKLTCYCLK